MATKGVRKSHQPGGSSRVSMENPFALRDRDLNQSNEKSAASQIYENKSAKKTLKNGGAVVQN